MTVVSRHFTLPGNVRMSGIPSWKNVADSYAYAQQSQHQTAFCIVPVLDLKPFSHYNRRQTDPWLRASPPLLPHPEKKRRYLCLPSGALEAAEDGPPRSTKTSSSSARLCLKLRGTPSGSRRSHSKRRDGRKGAQWRGGVEGHRMLRNAAAVYCTA